jgi:CheY-like chemotaxis protein
MKPPRRPHGAGVFVRLSFVVQILTLPAAFPDAGQHMHAVWCITWDIQPHPTPSERESTLSVSPVVLLVDDEAGVRKIVARSLAEDGYRVVEAGDGLEALRLLEEAGGEISLVITDVQMPGLDGIDLARRIVATPGHPAILFITGYEYSGRTLPGPVLTKPFGQATVRAEVRRLLAG